MKTDPFSDALSWLFDFRWETLLYWVLLVMSFVIAGVNWRSDPRQRTPETVAIWVFRLLIGAMWYQGTTWKLPLPVSGAFAFWLGETGKYAAFPFIRVLVTQVFEPLWGGTVALTVRSTGCMLTQALDALRMWLRALK